MGTDEVAEVIEKPDSRHASFRIHLRPEHPEQLKDINTAVETQYVENRPYDKICPSGSECETCFARQHTAYIVVASLEALRCSRPTICIYIRRILYSGEGLATFSPVLIRLDGDHGIPDTHL